MLLLSIFSCRKHAHVNCWPRTPAAVVVTYDGWHLYGVEMIGGQYGGASCSLGRAEAGSQLEPAFTASGVVPLLCCSLDLLLPLTSRTAGHAQRNLTSSQLQ